MRNRGAEGKETSERRTRGEECRGTKEGEGEKHGNSDQSWNYVLSAGTTNLRMYTHTGYATRPTNPAQPTCH